MELVVDGRISFGEPVFVLNRLIRLNNSKIGSKNRETRIEVSTDHPETRTIKIWVRYHYSKMTWLHLREEYFSSFRIV